MSETLASLRRKMTSAGDLQSVVRTMKALAASSIGQYERCLHSLTDYQRGVELGLSACLRELALKDPLAPRGRDASAGPISAVVFGSDQGLVGRFNEALADEALKFLSPLGEKAEVWAVGERVHGRLSSAGLSLAGVFQVPSSVKAIAPLVGQMLIESEGRPGMRAARELHLFYNSTTPGAGCTPIRQQLLPLDAEWMRKLSELPWPSSALPQVLGGGATTLGTLIREHLFVSLFRACAESLAGENATRLAAMERADKNIDELLANLQGHFHALRQSGIDEELFDVVSGFEALAKR
jgi:F-type H+-transporting ATPase subunit gamma